MLQRCCCDKGAVEQKMTTETDERSRRRGLNELSSLFSKFVNDYYYYYYYYYYNQLNTNVPASTQRSPTIYQYHHQSLASATNLYIYICISSLSSYSCYFRIISLIEEMASNSSSFRQNLPNPKRGSTNPPTRSKPLSARRSAAASKASNRDDCTDPGRVRVAVRVHPKNAEDLTCDADFADCVEPLPELKRVKLRKNGWSSESFTFDEVFTEKASQRRVYDAAAKPVVESVLNGYNGTVMAYGQTGTGKSYTVSRLDKDDPSERGIIVRALEDIIADTTSASDIVAISYLQLYLESIQDLLAPERINIPIMEDPKTGEVSLPNASIIRVRDLDHCLELLEIGEANRHAANTKLNAESSRSHAILMVYVQRSLKEKVENELNYLDNRPRIDVPVGNSLPTVLKSKLLIVDLAGSERLDKSGSEDYSSNSVDMLEDKLLGGLLAAGIDEGSCFSRYQSVLFRKASPHQPSSHLLARLRKYEALHKRCGPKTESYNKTLDQLKSSHNVGTSGCKYVLWISFSGLGNRILSLASAFLYALLTERVLLIDRGSDMVDLFCEPFPENSWLLPLDFPLKEFNRFNEKSSHSYGNMLKNKVISQNINSGSAGLLPAFAYLHLAHDYDDYDKLFFCEQDQLLLQRIPWLILRSDNYFVPSLFLIPLFEEELNKLFPQKDTVFHHLGRYLFHPSNLVWGLITRFYQAYLANAEERIGIQIRVFDTRVGPFQYVLDQILACTLNEKLLPNVTLEPVASTISGRTKVILMTSLSSGYYENIKNMYWEHPTVSGEIVSVHQPSHEEYQQTGKQMHNVKAWAEMYLLSLTDLLVTSSWSTFGYVAQGLGGLKPWILFKPENQTAPDPPCCRAMSMEPCFHAPPFYDCKAKVGTDTGVLVPHVRHCEDMSWGLKLVQPE